MKVLHVNEYRQQTMHLLQEMSTALRFLSTEIDGSIATDRRVDHDLLRRISQALQKQQGHLLKIAESSDPRQSKPDTGRFR